MKKALIIVAVILALGVGAYFFLPKDIAKKIPGVGNILTPKSGDTAWQYEKTIQAPIESAVTSQSDATLGDLEQNKVQVVVAKGAFDADTQVSLSNPDSVPEYYGSEIEPIGAPIQISAGEEPVRLNEKATISFKVDPSLLTGDKSFIHVVYYSGDKWEYIKPTSIDETTGLITFDTYHFSFFGASKIKDETKLIYKWSYSQSLDDTLRKNTNDRVDYVAGQVVDQILEKMGLEESAVKTKVLKDLLTDDGFREIYDAAAKQGDDFDAVDLAQKVALLSGKKIAQIVDESALQKGLENISGDAAEDVAAVAKAAGYIAEGQYKDAAKIIGEQIADKFLITTAGKIAAQVIQGQIDSWKSSEVDAAYKAYRDGSDAKFFGYNVDKGDFDAVWNQMRGIGRQLAIDAIKKENDIRAESGMEPLSEKQADMVRGKVKESFRAQFESRAKEEEALGKRAKDLEMLMTAFKDNNFFDESFGPTGLDKGYEFDQKMEILYHFTEKMLKDTKREWFVDLKGLKSDKNLLLDQITLAAKFYFAVPDGKKQYYEYLTKEFGIEFFPELKELGGAWPNSTLTITDVIVPPGWAEEAKKKKEAGSEDDLGCDFSIDPSVLKGQVVPVTLNITPSGEGGGTFSMSGEDMDDMSFPFTYSTGVLSGSMSKEGAVGTLNLTASESDDEKSFKLGGSFNIAYGELKILISLSGTKVKPVPVKPATKK